MSEAQLPAGWPAMSIAQAHAILSGPGMPTAGLTRPSPSTSIRRCRAPAPTRSSATVMATLSARPSSARPARPRPRRMSRKRRLPRRLQSKTPASCFSIGRSRTGERTLLVAARVGRRLATGTIRPHPQMPCRSSVRRFLVGWSATPLLSYKSSPTSEACPAPPRRRRHVGLLV